MILLLELKSGRKYGCREINKIIWGWRKEVMRGEPEEEKRGGDRGCGVGKCVGGVACASRVPRRVPGVRLACIVNCWLACSIALCVPVCLSIRLYNK